MWHNGQNYFRQELCCCLGINSSWVCGADCWPVSESGTENILASDSSSESSRPPWWFIAAGKDSSRLRFGSKYLTPSWIFCKDRIAGVRWGWSSLPRRPKKDRGKTRSFSVVVRDCCSLAVRAHRYRTVSSRVICSSYRFLALVRWQCCPFFKGLLKCSNALFTLVNAGSEITENGLLSGSERRKRSMAMRLSDGFHRWTFVNWQCAIFLPRRRTKLIRKKN